MKNIKALKEQYNKILDEIDALYELGISETRSLTDSEDERVAELNAKANDIKAEIEEEEKRSLEESTKISSKKGEENMDGILNEQELEIRGVHDFIRGVDTEELRAMTANSDGKGIIPKTLDTNILKSLREVAPLFNEVKKFTPIAGTLTIPVEKTIGEGSFLGEFVPSGPNTNNQTKHSGFTLDTVELTQKRAGTEIQLTQQLINDSGIDIVSYSQELLFRRLGYLLDSAMISGKKGERAFDGLEDATPKSRNYYNTGLNTADEEYTASTHGIQNLRIDHFIGALASMKFEMQSGCKWIMNRKQFEYVHRLMDATGNLYVVREVVNGTVQYKLFGCPILIHDVVKDEDIFLVNIKEAYRGMIKKGASLSKISEDTTNRRNGTITLILDTYVDAVMVQPEAVVRLKLHNGLTPVADRSVLMLNEEEEVSVSKRGSKK